MLASLCCLHAHERTPACMRHAVLWASQEEQRRGQAQPRVTYVYQLETAAAVQTLRQAALPAATVDVTQTLPAARLKIVHASRECCRRMPDMLLCIRDNFDMTPALEDTALQNDAIAESFISVLFQHGRLRCRQQLHWPELDCIPCDRAAHRRPCSALLLPDRRLIHGTGAARRGSWGPLRRMCMRSRTTQVPSWARYLALCCSSGSSSSARHARCPA